MFKMQCEKVCHVNADYTPKSGTQFYCEASETNQLLAASCRARKLQITDVLGRLLHCGRALWSKYIARRMSACGHFIGRRVLWRRKRVTCLGGRTMSRRQRRGVRLHLPLLIVFLEHARRFPTFPLSELCFSSFLKIRRMKHWFDVGPRQEKGILLRCLCKVW